MLVGDQIPISIKDEVQIREFAVAAVSCANPATLPMIVRINNPMPIHCGLFIFPFPLYHLVLETEPSKATQYVLVFVFYIETKFKAPQRRERAGRASNLGGDAFPFMMAFIRLIK
jgi:hypothetical protein